MSFGKFKLRIAATVIAGLSSLGIYFYPNELKLMDALPEAHEQVWVIEDNELELLFNRPVDPDKSVVLVTDPQGKMIVDKLETYKGVLLQVKTKSPYAPHGYMPGTYEVRWIVQAVDGKKADGKFHFHLKDSHAGHGGHHEAKH
jgi:methionine-rich copper-binding protein CopC